MRRLHAAAVVVAVAGTALTGVLGLATWSAHRDNEDRLLRQRTREAGAVLEASLPGLQTPLAATAELAEVTEGADADSFARLMGPLVGPETRFVSASVWRIDVADPRSVLTLGDPPALAGEPPDEIRAFIERSTSTPTATLSVVGLLDRDEPRLGYSFTSSRDPARFMAYAESALPADRVSMPDPDSAFAGLDYAIYLGGAEVPGSLLAASTPDLPIAGQRAVESVQFGDTTLTLVMTPIGDLGGRLLAALPRLILAGGALITAASAALTERLLRGRDEAHELAADNARLYDEQRSLAYALQQSLLPRSLPDIAGGELAGRYQPGVAGMEIGGDWYDALCVDDDHLALVVGDVSGRGLPAASVMASLRFAARAFASEGASPGAILTKLNDLTPPEADGHFATVVCVTIDLNERTISVANAGHPHPLLVQGDQGSFLETDVGQPVGVAPGARYQAATVPLPAEGTLLLFTDGLFERRGERIDVGLERVRACATKATGDLSQVLDTVLTELTDGNADDDVAVLGVRWTR